MVWTIDRRTLLTGAIATGVACATRQAFATVPADPVRDAFLAGFPLYEFARTAWSVARPTADRPQGSFNTVIHRRKLTDPTSRIITTPNNDCLVSTARIDLSGGPVWLTIPDVPDRYFSVVMMDAFTDNFFIIGTRASGGKGGRFLITPPAWRGHVPQGARRVSATTTDVWMLVRILVDGPWDYPRVNALQDRITLFADDGGVPPGSLLPVPPEDVMDPANFLAVANIMLARAPANDPRVMRARRHAPAGLRRGDPAAYERLDLAARAQWRMTIPAMLKALPMAGSNARREAAGWSYSLPSTGRFGSDDLQRAQVALIGLAALPPEEAFYGHALTDDTGNPFDGAYRYRLRIPPEGIPVTGFWSITLYRIEPDGRLFLFPNPINRYSIGDRTPGLIRNPDHSLDIILQHERPVGSAAANWLPVPPGPFRPALRAYLAKPEVLQLRWKMPAIMRLGQP